MKLPKRKVKDDLLDEEVQTKKVNILSNKKVLIAIGVVVVIVVIFLLKSLLGGSKGLNYYDTLTSLFTNELGTFSYTIDVRTGEEGTLITTSAVESASVDELVDAESAEVEGTETEEVVEEMTESKNEFQDWNKYADVKSGDWKYPNYQITISGATTNLEPLTTDFTIAIATENYNSTFTEVVCIDGNYYFDVESMYNWFANSGDSYLMEIGSTLPNGSKWLVIPESELVITSRYAESGETSLSGVIGLDSWYHKFLINLQTVVSSIKSSVGDTGLTSAKETATMNLSGDNVLGVVNAVKSIALNQGSFYDSVTSSAYSNGVYTDEQYTQAKREKDNVIQAFYDLATYLTVNDASSLNATLSGACRTYTNGYGNSAIEASLACQYTADGQDVIIQFSGTRSGDSTEITLPSGSQYSDTSTVYREALDSLFDYLNFTMIDTEVKLDINPETITADILDKFIELVNSTGYAPYYVTRHNVYDYIDTYSNMTLTADSSTEDIANNKLVVDLADSLNNIVGGIVVEKEVEVVEEVEQYPDIEFTTLDGVEFVITYDKELSDSQLAVMHVEAINKGEAEVTMNATDFSLHTLLSSIYPANNDTLLLNYDNTWEIELTTEFTMATHEWASFDLYFVLSDDSGHMDLFYDENQVGTAVEY